MDVKIVQKEGLEKPFYQPTLSSREIKEMYDYFYPKRWSSKYAEQILNILEDHLSS
ncbi:hypothetical protein TCA2_4593 [Paenibacillus sp. TCA20]|uniref:hypothetical protein n=1 Tax=Paenibacillus sp. TCA20 TaxID=1499968 RepID=UPI0004D6569E|nr:hypothetical protein [Paenibacillus sp. TCA20]GAK42101.1 hypothetical protein TCA2_4593 [Paenibacillus sp. TCA20]